MRLALLLLFLCIACQTQAQASEDGCRPAEAVRMRVRFFGEAARDVLLESTLPDGFRLLDATSLTQLWSAGTGASSTQRVAGMDAPLGTSFTAVHLDADGVQDRLYAGDRAGRIWRFDLHAGARPTAWMEATLLADMGVDGGGRGLVAPPDVIRIQSPTGAPGLNIAIGTASTGAPRNDHRFYVLRDTLEGRPTGVLREVDLERLSPPAAATRARDHGYYLVLGTAQVLAQALTLDGRIHFVTVERARNLLAACATTELPTGPAALSVTVLRAPDGAVVAPADSNPDIPSQTSQYLRRPLSALLSASSGVELAPGPPESSGIVPCRVDNEPLPGCFLDTRPQRRWWRREDAD
jgi:hypothetical protein